LGSDYLGNALCRLLFLGGLPDRVQPPSQFRDGRLLASVDLAIVLIYFIDLAV
jgi:hypothetical protein